MNSNKTNKSNKRQTNNLNPDQTNIAKKTIRPSDLSTSNVIIPPIQKIFEMIQNHQKIEEGAEVILEISKLDPKILTYCLPDELTEDEEFLIKLLSQDINNFKFLPLQCRKMKNIVKFVLKTIFFNSDSPKFVLCSISELYQYISLDPKIKADLQVLRELFNAWQCKHQLISNFPLLSKSIRGNYEFVSLAVKSQKKNIKYIGSLELLKQCAVNDFAVYAHLSKCKYEGSPPTQNQLIIDDGHQKSINPDFNRLFISDDVHQQIYSLIISRLGNHPALTHNHNNIRMIIGETPINILKRTTKYYQSFYLDYIKNQTGILVSDFFTDVEDLMSVCIFVMLNFTMQRHYFKQKIEDSRNRLRMNKFLDSLPFLLRNTTNFKTIVLACWFNHYTRKHNHEDKLYTNCYDKHIIKDGLLLFNVIMFGSNKNDTSPSYGILCEELQNLSIDNFEVIANVCCLSPLFRRWFFGVLGLRDLVSFKDKTLKLILPKILSNKSNYYSRTEGPGFHINLPSSWLVSFEDDSFIKLIESYPHFYLHNYLRIDIKNNYPHHYYPRSDLNPNKEYIIVCQEDGQEEVAAKTKRIVGFKSYLLELAKIYSKYPIDLHYQETGIQKLHPDLVDLVISDLDNVDNADYLVNLISLNPIFFCWLFGIGGEIHHTPANRVFKNILKKNPDLSQKIHNVTPAFLKFNTLPINRDIFNTESYPQANPHSIFNSILKSVEQDQTSEFFFEILQYFIGVSRYKDYKYQLFQKLSSIREFILKCGTGPKNQRCMKFLRQILDYHFYQYVGDDVNIDYTPEELIKSFINDELFLLTSPTTTIFIQNLSNYSDFDLSNYPDLDLKFFAPYVINKYNLLLNKENFTQILKFISPEVLEQKKFKNARQIIRYELCYFFKKKNLYKEQVCANKFKFALASNPHNFLPLIKIAHKSILKSIRSLIHCFKIKSGYTLPQLCIELILLNFDFNMVLNGNKIVF